jgi:hypothetical protein
MMAAGCGTPTGATTDIHYMVLPFMLGTGEAVMCTIIFKSNPNIREISVNMKTGIDITCNGIKDNKKFVHGRPTCFFFQGKHIPCFYGTLPKASITTTFLMEMLKYLDKLGGYYRSICHPFLLLDGYHSRMMLPFFDYINNLNHKWFACFRVPYATHLWQVDDASSLNGAFKIELTKAKLNCIKHCSVSNFEPIDIVLLINIAIM